MKFKMAQNSVFAVLLRSSWWISALVAAVLVLLAAAVPSPALTLFLLFAAIPFLVISVISAWKRRHVPSAARVQEVTALVSAMSWKTFADTMERAFRDDGCGVTRLPGGAADFSLDRSGRIALVSARRWKASQVGVPALRELAAAREAQDAHEGIVVTLGEVTDQAATFARAHRIQFLTAVEMARLMPWLR